jgi:hypothetical protein
LCFLPLSLQSPSPAPVQKSPIPQEHMPMVQAFDAMLERCKGRANTTVSYMAIDYTMSCMHTQYMKRCTNS